MTEAGTSTELGVTVALARGATALIGLMAAAGLVHGGAPAAAHATEPWEVVASPSTRSDEHNRLYGVDCAGADDCWAVGFVTQCVTAGGGSVDPVPVSVPGVGACNVHKTLVEHWDGSQWTIVTSPSVSPKSNQLLDVDCVSATDCWAVGFYTGAAGVWTLALHWNGTRWDVVPTPNQASPAPDGQLSAVTCLSATDCWAVGRSADYLTPDLVPVSDPLVMHWDGLTWNVVAVPNRDPDQSHNLQDVHCLRADSCWAVGYSLAEPDGFTTLVTRWDGSAWRLVDSPSPSPRPRRLTGDAMQGVTCTAANDCWAVGSGTNGSLAQHWDGAAWRSVAVPGGGTLYDVTCVSSSDCRAVGGWWANVGDQILGWDGERWSVVPAPGRGDTLSGVTCTAAGCWAVGEQRTGVSGPGPTANMARTLVLRTVKQVRTHLTFTAASATGAQHSDAARFEARLVDEPGTPVSGAEVVFTLAGGDAPPRAFTATTGADGIATATATLTGAPGGYVLTARYAGDPARAASVATANVDIGLEDSALDLTVARADDEVPSLAARLSDLDSPATALAGRLVDFWSDGERVGAARTGDDGVAVLVLPPTHRGANRTHTAVFAGDAAFHRSSDTVAGRH